MKELSDAILTSLNKKLNDGEMEKLVDAHVTKFLKSCVEDSLSNWGDVHKALKEKISKDTLQCLDRFDLVQYNSIVAKLMQDRIGAIYVADAEKHLKKILDSVFKRPKDKYKLSELVEEIKDDEAHEEEMSFHCDGHSKLVFLYMDSEPNKKDYECEYRIVYDKELGTIISATCKDYIKGRRVIGPKPVDNMHGFELLMFQIISYQIPVEWDEDRCDLSYERD
jgi:hypothetical protein